MTALAVEKNSGERRDKRAKSIAAMGLVNREGDRFRVATPSLRGKQTIPRIIYMIRLCTTTVKFQD